jgi:hypothetical protein
MFVVPGCCETDGFYYVKRRVKRFTENEKFAEKTKRAKVNVSHIPFDNFFLEFFRKKDDQNRLHDQMQTL